MIGFAANSWQNSFQAPLHLPPPTFLIERIPSLIFISQIYLKKQAVTHKSLW